MAVTATAIAVGGDILLTLIEAYMMAAKQQGLTAEQAREKFLSTYPQFMAESAVSVEEVNESGD